MEGFAVGFCWGKGWDHCLGVGIFRVCAVEVEPCPLDALSGAAERMYGVESKSEDVAPRAADRTYPPCGEDRFAGRSLRGGGGVGFAAGNGGRSQLVFCTEVAAGISHVLGCRFA